MDHSTHTRLAPGEFNEATLMDAAIYGPRDEKIGTVSHVHGSGSDTRVIVDVGGFLGIGEKAVALKLDRLKMTPEQDASLKLVMDIKKEELTNAPTFKSKKEQEQEKQAERAQTCLRVICKSAAETARIGREYHAA